MKAIYYAKSLIIKNYLLTVFFLYLLGFIIYSIPISFYFTNFPINNLKLLNYLSASLWYLISLLVVYYLYKYFEKFLIKTSLNTRKLYIIGRYLLVYASVCVCFTLLFIFFMSFLIHFNAFYSFFRLLSWKLGHFRFQVFFFPRQFINPIIFAITALIFASIMDVDVKKLKVSALGIIIFINIIAYSQGIYTHIPKALGGGRPTSVGLTFKKGFIPKALKNIINEGHGYTALLVDEDVTCYYVIFREGFSFPYQHYHFIKTVIPKENIAVISVYD
jgi:hypothetical protein